MLSDWFIPMKNAESGYFDKKYNTLFYYENPLYILSRNVNTVPVALLPLCVGECMPLYKFMASL